MIKKIVVLFALLVITGGFLSASHLVGGSLGYEYMGKVGVNYRYKIILTVYNNCDSTSFIPLPVASQNVSIYLQDIPGNPMGGGNKTFLQTLSLSLVDSNIVVPPTTSGCSIGQSVCIYKGVYEAIVDLPLNFNGYHLYFQNFARNAAITNLFNPGGTAMAFHAYIAPSLVNNSSPVFQDDPVPFLCVNDTVSILNTAIDPDGDQLIFSFVTPFQGSGAAPAPLPWTIAPVTYNAGYSTAQPFGIGGFSFINGGNGLTQYMSTTTGNYVVAVEIREYRNGNLIGVSRRDLQLLVINCPPNPAPNLSSTGGSGVTQYTIDECENLTFPITFTDPNGDSLTLVATGQIFDPNFITPPATINSPVVGGSIITSIFNWTAPCGSSQSLPYLFTVSVTDNGCPPKTTNEVYEITVNPPTPPSIINGTMIVCPNGTATYTTPPIPGFTFNWTVNGGVINSGQGSNSINVTWGSSGTGTVTVNALNGCGCPSTIIDTNVTILVSFANAGNDTTICLGDSVQLGGSPTGPVGSTFLWTPTTSLSSSTVANPMAFPTSTTTYIVTVDNGICPVYDTVTVFVGSATINAGNDTTICIGNSVQLNATGGFTYSWTPTTGLSNPNIANPIASPISTTTYVVFVTDALNCSGTDSITVTIVSPPVITISNDTTICDGACVQLNATGGTSYSWSPTTGLSNPNIANPIACPTVNTTYIVTVSNAANCSATDSVTITLNPLPTITASNDTTICDGACATLNASGGTSYTWSPTTGLSNPNIANPTACPTVTTTYIVTGTDANSCTNTDTVVVTVNPLPTANAGNDTTICIGDSVQLNATGGTVYSWIPAGTLTNPNIANPIAFPNTTTTYIVTVTDGLGCIDTDTVIVTVASFPVITITNDTTICDGACLQLNATGGTSYSWSPTTGLSNPNIANPIACPTTNTTYTVIVTNAANCSATDSVTITINPLPTITASNDTTICDGACATLNASGGISYTWSPTTGLSNPNIANPTACVTTPTTYVVTGTDAFGCVNTDTVTISINPLPIITASPDVWVCVGDSAQIFANGGTSYTWSPTTGLSNPNISNPMAGPLNTTLYVVTGTDANGCSNTDSVLVTANDTVPISLANDTTICAGDSVQLGGNPTSVTGTTFNWFPAASLNNPTSANPIAFPTVTTTYFVTATNDTCSTTDSITVTVHPISNINAGNDLSMCFGDTVQLTASGGASYVWSPGNSLSDSTIFNPLAFPTASTSYIVSALDTNGCNNNDTVVVTVNPLPTVNAGNDVSICDGDTAQLQATGASSYLWTPSAGLSDTTIANPLAFPTVTTSYVVTGTDTNSCSNTDTVVVNVNALPTITAFSDTAVCSGVSVQLNATGGSAYTWTPAASLNNANIPNPIASPLTTTTYSVTGVDTNGCINVDSVTITINALPSINAGADVAICIGDTTQLLATGGSSYLWTPSAGLSDTTIANPLAFPTVTTTYIVMGTDTNACEGTDTVVVTVNPLPTISAALTDTIFMCAGDSAQLNASGGTSYVWTPNTNITNNTIANPFVFPPVTTTYYVTGSDVNSCSNFDSVVVSVFSIPDLTDTVICIGDSIQLLAFGPVGATFTWTPVTGLSNPNIANPYTSTTVTITYTVTVQDTNGCIDTTQITVTAEDKPNAAFTVETTPACDGILAIFDNTSTGADSYLWLFGDGSQSNETHPTYIFTYGSSFTTILNAFSINGCVDTAMFNISSLTFEEQFNLTPPSVLTPNRDGHNDEFRLDLPEAISQCTNIEIFNRWGMKVFESKGQNIGWDGRTTTGAEVPDGTYFYIVDVNGITKKGSITLMR